MQLQVTLENLLPQPAQPATPAGPPAALQLLFTETNDPHRAMVTSTVAGAVSGRTTVYTKMEARAIGQWFMDFADGKYDMT
jgi:hypothetical protein